MSKAKQTQNPKVLDIRLTKGTTEAKAVASAATAPAVNAAIVMDAYQGNILGSDVNLMALIESLQESTDEAKAGDLSNLEAMLIGQATALQTIFTSFAKRATLQPYQKNLEAFMGMALKAQAQSRATISALVDLKYPRQATFVKQANIAHGPQQVNNGSIPNHSAHARARDSKSLPNELLEDASHERTTLDAGTTAAATRSNPAVETVEAIHRAKKPRRQGNNGA